MRFQHACLASIGVSLPEEIWTSDDVERRLEPLYQRLKLPEGRLALMSGIDARRVWPAGTLPSGPSEVSGRRAIEAAGIDPARIGCLIHASVCRDFLEPATASRVHDRLGLPARCMVFDLSNACLGLLNGAVQIAAMIDAGLIEAGLVVGTENSRPLLEQTIAHLNADTSLTRQSVKPAFASLTIGSGSCAWLLTRDDTDMVTRLVSATATARTEFHDLCLSHTDTAGAEMAPLMDTDSERLMAEGVATGAANFVDFLAESAWSVDSIDRTVCHQVGGKHRSTMLAALGLSEQRDWTTFAWLGNTGSVALPLTLADAVQRGELQPGQRLAMLGIGSGINSVMLGCRWGQTKLLGDPG